MGQRGFDENDLPKENEKRRLYELGKQLFFDSGYLEIGMDHFALPSDSLADAMRNKKLHRNFMGYTSGKTQLMIGLGMSAISDSWYAFAQNDKTVEGYQQQISEGNLAIFRGHMLTETDLVIRRHILNLMCHLETEWNQGLDSSVKEDIVTRLHEMIEDGIVEVTAEKVSVKEEGRMFIRNVCMAFDLRLIENKPDTRIFSMTI